MQRQINIKIAAIVTLLVISLFGFAIKIAYGAPFSVGVGGIGTTTPSGILYGSNSPTIPLKTVNFGSGCSFVAGTLSCGGSFSFTPTSWGNSTSTLIGFLNGFLVNAASSTITGSVTVTGTSTLGTTTTSRLNGIIVVDGATYPKTDVGVRAALSQCGSNGIGKIYIPTGFYSMTNTFVVPSDCMVTGDGTSTILSIASGKSVLFQDVSNSGLYNVHMDCINEVAGGVCVDVKNSSNIDIDHSLVTNAKGFGVFIHADGTSSTTNIRITHNYMTGLGNNDLIGGGPSDSTRLDSVSGVLVDGNYLSQTYSAGSTYEFVFDIVAARHTTFTNNFTYGKVAYGFEQTQNYQDEFSNNDFNPALNGTVFVLSLQSSTSPATADAGLIVTGNRITGGEISLTGDVLKKMTNVIVSHNTIYSAIAQNGIDATNISLSQITNNTITGSRTFDNGVKLTNSDNTTVAYNTISTYATAVNDAGLNSTNSISFNIYNNLSATPVIGFGWMNFVGNTFGIGTSTPFAQFTIMANKGDVNTTLFAIASSSPTYATTTLFSVSNTGAASTTSLFGAALSSCNGASNALTWNGGFFGCNSLSSVAFPFTPQTYGNSTSSVMAFLAGLVSNGSTTVSSLGSGLVGSNNGLLYGLASSSLFGYTPVNPTRALTVAGTANQVTSSAGSQDLSADRTWTLSLPQALQFPLSFTSTYGTTTYASSTALTTGFLAVTGTTGTTSIASGQGFTVGSSQFVVQQTSGFVGVNNSSPVLLVDIVGSYTSSNGGQSGGVLAYNSTPELNIRSNTTTSGTESTMNFSNTSAASNAFSSGTGQIGVIRTNLPTAGNSAMVFRTFDNTDGGFTGLKEDMRLDYNGNLGIGTTSPFARLSIGAPTTNSFTNPWLFAIGSSTPTATTTLFSIDSNGHFFFNGTVPTVLTGASAVFGSDTVGSTTASTGATRLIYILFSQPFLRPPHCFANINLASSTLQSGTTTVVNITSTTTTQFAITASAPNLGGSTIDWWCPSN